MFGLNDNDTQRTDNNDQKTTDAPAIMNNNPFSDSSSDTPSSSPIPEPSSAPVSAPALPDSPTPTPEPTTSTTSSDNNLMDLKQQALQSLQPLVNHLDQTPEEKFKTTMMLIQATDNADLVKQAYEAANAITDEKARAQALLDIVNEINYFTQHNGEGEAKT